MFSRRLSVPSPLTAYCSVPIPVREAESRLAFVSGMPDFIEVADLLAIVLPLVRRHEHMFAPYQTERPPGGRAMLRNLAPPVAMLDGLSGVG
jgi:hypothetical protein